MKTFLVVIFTTLFMLSNAFATLPSTVDEATIAGTANQNGESLTVGAMGAIPLDFINGHISGLAQRSFLSGVSVSEIYLGHAEGGVNLFGFSVKVFGGYTRDDDRGINQFDVGYFGEFPEHAVTDKISFTGGFGNFNRSGGLFGGDYTDAEFDAIKGLHGEGVLSDDAVARMGLYDQIVLGASYKPLISKGLKWLVFGRVNHSSGFGLDIRFTPDVDEIKNYDLSVKPTASFELGERVSIQLGSEILLQGNIEYEEPLVFTTMFSSVNLSF